MTPRRKFLKGAAAAIAAPAILKSRNAGAGLLDGGGGQAPTFSTFNKPFAANSPWNSKPVNPVTNGVHMFTSSHTSPFPANIPFLVYEASPTDPPMTLKVKVPDEFNTRNVTIPHWPAGIKPPGTGDSQIDIYDQTTGVLHDLYGVVLRGGVFTAALYGCCPISGSGFATPSKPNSGSRAAGNATLGGLIRAWEVQAVLDGQPNPIKHAICLNMDGRDMIQNQAMFPAIGEDHGSIGTYTANSTNGFGMGALLMLPQNFDMTQFNSPFGLAQGYALRDYGGYIIDTTVNTFSPNYDNDANTIMAKNSAYLGHDGNDWAVLRDNISQCISATGWIDGDGNPMKSGNAGFNQLLGTGQSANWEGTDLLGMRGGWSVSAGSTFGHYDTTLFQGIGGYKDPGGSTPGSVITTAVHSNPHIAPAVSPPHYNWWTLWGSGLMLASPIPNRAYNFDCLGTGALTINIQVFDGSNARRTSFSLSPGQQHSYTWPSDLTNTAGFYIQMSISNNSGAGGTIKVQMI